MFLASTSRYIVTIQFVHGFFLTFRQMSKIEVVLTPLLRWQGLASACEVSQPHSQLSRG